MLNILAIIVSLISINAFPQKKAQSKNKVLLYWETVDKEKANAVVPLPDVQKIADVCYKQIETKIIDIIEKSDQASFEKAGNDLEKYLNFPNNVDELFLSEATQCFYNEYSPLHMNTVMTNLKNQSQDIKYVLENYDGSFKKTITKIGVYSKMFSVTTQTVVKWVSSYIYGAPLMMGNAVDAEEVKGKKAVKTYLYCMYEDDKALSDWAYDSAGNYYQLNGRWTVDDEKNGYFGTLQTGGDLIQACLRGLSKKDKATRKLEIGKIKMTAGNTYLMASYPIIFFVEKSNGKLGRLN